MRAGVIGLFLALSMALLPAAAGAGLPQPAGGAPLTQPAEQPDLVLEVRLGEHQLSDAIPAYQQGDDVYLPLCELARLLTLAIRCHPAQPRASGYILDEQRPFHFDGASGDLSVDGRQARIAARDFLRKSDDLYVSSRVLATWLPVDLALDMPNLTVQATAREKLPLQARLERESQRTPGARPDRNASERAQYANVAVPYGLADAPFVDQTVSLDMRPGSSAAAYNAYASADLLGMEAVLYVARGTQEARPATRLTLGRHDPDGGLLGPLHARTALIGSVTAPAIAHITHGSADGNGFTLSNRPLSQAPLMDTHSLRGDLAPGWDVELYYNDALVGFQGARADGKYSFDDLPLHYGANDFRLVFHGPLGQLRVERHSFLLEDAPLAPGELVYHVTGQRSRQGSERRVLGIDWGWSKQLAANAALVQLRGAGRTRDFASVGLNAYWQALIASATIIRAGDGGQLAQLALRTRVGGVALAASRAQAHDFVSDLYQGGPNKVKLRDEVRADAMLGGLQVAAHARREQRAGGDQIRELSLRTSIYRAGTAVSNAVRWQSAYGSSQTDGILQASRRLAGIGISGQALYQVRPQAALSALAISADKRLWPGYQLNLNAARTFVHPEYRFSAALNKSLGRFGMGVGAFYTSHGDVGATLQLFTALGREPRRANWAMEAAPMAATGAASILVFLDRNRNGVMDGSDEALKGAAFAVNGGTHMASTGDDGIAFLGRLATNQYLDVAVDATSLEDPQWQPASRGMRILPRAGKVSQLNFAIGITAEVDGSAYLLDKGGKRRIGGVELELVDEAGQVAASATSSSDGYYVITGVAPGRYRLRVAAAQLARLGMGMAPGYPDGHALLIGPEGAFINGKDLVVAPLADAAVVAVSGDAAGMRATAARAD